MKLKTKDLVYMAMYVAMFVVLEYVSNMIPILMMPNGGKVTLAIIPLLISSYHLGIGKSIIVVALSLLVKFMIKAPYFLSIPQFLFDYILPFGIYAFASMFKNVTLGDVKVPMGVVYTNVIRFLSHTTAGVLYWSDSLTHESLWIGSALYNGPYMLITLVLTLLVMVSLLPSLKNVGGLDV